MKELLARILFEDDNGLTVTATGHKYRKMIEEYLIITSNSRFRHAELLVPARWGNV